ncbi:type II secretion system F family protein [Paraburkholderia sp. Tr-20389]|uniref:type II secretion system F family protein n=1 Tax=Paraburkholderia sp. Tr-20389 TaxID=2703903 RepID=UPI001980313A|nr:type II secretion system F family protein [Paraburkholderia sp. Tr-20389]MBN3757113.1 type II secretion system F family protein [Paraburkholderia sp. Tr-20389]
METQQILVLAAMFAIVFGAAWKAMSLLRPDPLKRRIDGIAASSSAGMAGMDGAPGAADDESPAWMETVAKVSHHVARLSLPKDDWDKSVLRRRFANAGLRSDSAPAIYFAAKTLLALALPAFALVGITLLAGEDAQKFLLMATLGSAALGFYLPNVVLSRLVESRKRTIFEDLPDALDLMTVCVEAGLGLDSAMQRVAEEIGVKSHALKDELELVLLELRAGSGRDKALRNLALRTGVEDIDTLTSMLIQADRFGTSVGDSLRVFIDALRTRRRLRAEEQAAKIALKLLFPLMFCIFPTLIIVLIGPAAMRVVHELLPTMSGMH